MKKSRKSVRMQNVFTLRICALVLVLWLAGTGFLVRAAAEDTFRQWEAAADFLVRPLPPLSGGSLPGAEQRTRIQALGMPYLHISAEPSLPGMLPQGISGLSSDDLLWGKWGLLYGFDAALGFYDAGGQLQTCSGDWLSFAYIPGDAWEAGESTPAGYSCVSVTQDALRDLISDNPAGDPAVSLISPLLRMEGSFSGSEFCPVSVERGVHPDLPGSRVPQMQALDRDGEIEWESVWEADEVPEGPLISIYCTETVGVREYARKVRFDGTEYASLSELLRSGAPVYQAAGFHSGLIYTESAAASGKTVLLLHAHPAAYAMSRLAPFCLVSLALTVLLTWLLLRGLRESVSAPMQSLGRAVRKGTTVVPSSRVKEICTLQQYFADSRQDKAEKNARIQQLGTSLQYTRDAEENRRKLVSGITHQLKNPLAVIHSYAEALQSHIDESKREQYLKTILEESESMDAMVLTMLDLSRLESGRVHLTLSRFSLSELAVSLAAQYRPLAEEKGIRLICGRQESFLLTADESRIRQAAANLLNNAVRYTTAGGQITVSVFTEDGHACLETENPAPPLSEEMLHAVWEPFCRGQTGSGASGTGLGLAVVRGILQLHGGSCYAENRQLPDRQSGVAFGFRIPLEHSEEVS